ncbi:adhesion G-protein coupled receptor G2-like [Engraulis encrasicolus]|uniref:adhesion G-protein coupled receptor G2-like n=1 Tax=Engraulis encrasicolus TaxID=184585 RepID=UPI002FD69A06
MLVVGRNAGKEINCYNCTWPGNDTNRMDTKLDLNITEGLIEENGVVSAHQANLILFLAGSDVLESMKSLLDSIGDASTAAVTIGDTDITGSVAKVKSKKDITIAFSKQIDNEMLLSNPHASKQIFRWSIDIPAEALAMSGSANNGSGVVSILRFPNISPDAKNSSVLGAVYGVSMAAPISNLKNKIKIYFENNKWEGYNVTCNSWNGVGNQTNWTEDGCTTLETDSTITCQCSHLTFFAILMSLPGNGTISESDLSNLTYISYIGCGLSLFFLGVALFMHFLLRRGKSSQSVQVLMNVFVALFLLNLTFLTNEWVANTGSYVGCVAIAMLMHYSMLATFTWFAMQALHLYLHLVMMLDIKTFKHYMLKMCLPAWICPALVVIVIAALDKYQLVDINTSSGKGAKMCWTKDMLVHYAVNIGYYALVFLFSMGIFVVMVQRICMARKMQSKDVKQPSTSKNLSIIMSLLFLLGITWGVAFFSYGPMLIPSYYIFCILNSFQGLFLFIYYYNNSRDVMDGMKHENPFKSSTSSSTSASSNTYVTND